jgi:hypothetical protein
MKRALLVIVLVIVVLIPAAGVSAAAGEIQVLADKATPHFAQDIVFDLQAQSNNKITEVNLFYRDTLEIAVNRAYPTFSAGTNVSAQYNWQLLPGEVPVGAQIQYYWVIKDANGQQLKTEIQTVAYDDTRFDWQKTNQGNVNLFYYGNNKSRADKLLNAAVAALSHIKDQIGVSPKLPVKIYVYDTKEDMGPALISRSQSYDELTTTLGVLISKDTLLLLGSAEGATETIAHELTHLVVGQATDNPFQAPLPRWLDEGLAMYNEGSLPDYNKLALAEAIASNSLISVRSLSAYTGDPNQVNLFYAESYSIIDHLLSQYGKDKMVELLNEFKKGAYQDDALQAVYGFGLEGLDTKWRAWVGAPQRPAPVPAPNTHTASVLQLAAG